MLLLTSLSRLTYLDTFKKQHLPWATHCSGTQLSPPPRPALTGQARGHLLVFVCALPVSGVPSPSLWEPVQHPETLGLLRPRKVGERKRWAGLVVGGHAPPTPRLTLGTAKLGHLQGSSTETHCYFVPSLRSTHTHHTNSTRKPRADAVARDCQAGEGAPGEVISQALNRLMSWGLISPGSGDCPCPPPRKQAQRQPWVLGDTQGALDHGLQWGKYILRARCLEQVTSVNLLSDYPHCAIGKQALREKTTCWKSHRGQSLDGSPGLHHP